MSGLVGHFLMCLLLLWGGLSEEGIHGGCDETPLLPQLLSEFFIMGPKVTYIVLFGPIGVSVKLGLHICEVSHKCTTSDINSEALGDLTLCLAGYGIIEMCFRFLEGEKFLPLGGSSGRGSGRGGCCFLCFHAFVHRSEEGWRQSGALWAVRVSREENVVNSGGIVHGILRDGV